MRSISFKGQVLLAFGAAVVLLVGVGVLSYRRILEEDTDQKWVEHTHLVLERLDSVQVDLVDQESGQRGFALTRDRSFLEPYDRSRVQLQEDLTDLWRLTSDNLKQSEQRFRLLVSGVKDYAILMLDPEGHIASWSDGAERIKGYRAEEIIGQHFSRFYPAEDVEKGKPSYELKVAAAQGRFEDEGWRVRKDGSRFCVNRATEEVFRYSSKELIGQPLTLLMPERFRNAHLEGFERFLKTGEAHVIGKTLELEGQRKDGATFPIEISLSSWRTAEGAFFSGILSDITERKLAEEEMRLRNAQLDAANKELEAFRYSVSHDLRAPLRSIDGFSQALLEDCADKIDEAEKSHLHRIRASTQRMGVLIDDLLNLSRVARAEMHWERVNVSALARNIVAELQKAQSGQQAEFRIEDGIEAMGDPHLLRIVLENLLGNAWKFTSKCASARIEVGRTNHNDGRAYFVRDNGAGFDPAYAGKLFGAFQRLHGMMEFPGTGVGLATVQRIIHRHGGKIWAEGAVQKGASFYFTL